MTRPPEDLLLELLEEERDLLLSGNLSRLEDATERKIGLAAAVSARSAAIPGPRMRQLADAARRNAHLCDAARTGLRGAIERIAERARTAHSLQTYDRDGTRHVHHTSPGRLERRS